MSPLQSRPLNHTWSNPHTRRRKSAGAMETPSLSDNAEAIVVTEISRVLHTHPSGLDMNASFINNCGDSIHALRLSSACRRRGIRISVPDILQAINLNELISSAKRARPVGQHTNTNKLSTNSELPPTDKLFPENSIVGPSNICISTETQREFLLPIGEQKIANIIRHITQWPKSQLQRLKRAWIIALASEPIFRSEFKELNGSWYAHEKGVFMEPEWREILVNNEHEYARAKFSESEPCRSDLRGTVFFTVITPSPHWDFSTCTVICTSFTRISSPSTADVSNVLDA